MRKDSIKNTRINGEVKRELGRLIELELKDPRIHPLTSVISAEVAPDLKQAKIFISVLGDEEARKETLKGLKSAASFLRGQLAKNVNLRNTPELIFIMDESIERGIEMSKLIDRVNRDSEGKEAGEENE